VADDGGTNDVGDEAVVVAVPREEGGAGGAATVELGDGLVVFGGDVDFVLRDTGGPKEAD
jgi:hypothetical protein